MRVVVLAALALLASPASADEVLTQIRISWPIDQVGNTFKFSTGPTSYLAFNTYLAWDGTLRPFAFDFPVLADASTEVASLVADMRDGLDGTLTLSVGSFSVSRPESWAFGEFDFADGTGLRRLDYATRDFPGTATGIDWSTFHIDSFRVSAVGPISDALPDRARVVIDVIGRVPEPSSVGLLAIALSTAGPWRRRCLSR